MAEKVLEVVAMKLTVPNGLETQAKAMNCGEAMPHKTRGERNIPVEHPGKHTPASQFREKSTLRSRDQVPPHLSRPWY